MNRPAHTVAFAVNGEAVTVLVDGAMTAVDVLRAQLGLIGTKEGCSVGECGSCTILVDGIPTLSCLLLTSELEGRAVTTIESESDERIDRMREAFLAEEALQCGFCTPGMILVASRIPVGASDAEIRAALVGNVCRCTGYSSIVRAVRMAHRGRPVSESDQATVSPQR